MFADLFARLAQQAHRGLRRALAETTYLIDSTGVRLTAASDWARFSAKACGAKVHVIYDPDATALAQKRVSQFCGRGDRY